MTWPRVASEPRQGARAARPRLIIGAVLEKLSFVVIALALGCSHPHEQPPDASGTGNLADASVTSDGAVDAGVDAPSGLVGITVLDFTSVPAPGMTVVFQNADGTVAAMTTTDAQGYASATMLAGGSVTAERPQRAGLSGRWFFSFTGVKPGDELLVGAAPSPTPTIFQTTFLLPTYPNTYDYQIVTDCGDGSVLGSAAAPIATLTMSCSPVNVYVAAKNMMISNATIAALYAADVTVAPGGTVDLTGASYQPVTSMALDISGVSSNVTQTFAEIGISDGQTILDTEVASTGFGSNGEVTGTANVAVLPGTQFSVVTQLFSSGDQLASEEILQRVAPSNAYTVDTATIDTAWLLDGVDYNVAAEQIEWTETAGAVSPDYARAEIIVTQSHGFTREIAGPYQPGRLAVPVLPSPLDEFNVTAGDNADVDKFYLATVPGGWDAVRATVFNWAVFTPPVALGETAVASAPTNGLVVN